MALQIPENIGNPSKMTIGLKKNTNVVQSAFNRSKQVVELVGGGWVMSATWDILRPDQIPAMRSFLTAISGGTETFYFSDVSAPKPAVEIAGVFNVITNPNIGTIRISTPHFSQKVLSAGDYIAIPVAGGEYEYKMILFDVVTGVSGEADVTVRPVIRETVAIGQPIVYENPKGEFITTDDFSDWGIQSPVISTSVTINATEYF